MTKNDKKFVINTI